MNKRPRKAATGSKCSGQNERVDHPLRIIGGRFRGSLLSYHGDRKTRPMKDRTREAIFNLLGPSIKNKHAIDLFAGTGALGLEAISRGAASASFVERHIPTAQVIKKNIASLDLHGCTEVVSCDTFFWAGHDLKVGEIPWVVFCSPPYDFYVDRAGEMIKLINSIMQMAPDESSFVVESDDRFALETLPEFDRWDIRHYAPAIVAVCNFF